MLLIHQIILGDSVPPLNQQCLDSWRTLQNRDCDVVLWTDQKVTEFLARCPLETQILYERARNRGEASDILRVAITHAYGGLYVDWDVLLVDPDRFFAVMPDFESTGCVLLQDPYTKEPDCSCAYDNSLLYMRRGNPLALDFLREMQRNYSVDPLPDTPYLTGPLALTRFLDAHPHYKNDCRMVDVLTVYSFHYEEVIELTKGAGKRDVLKRHCNSGGAPAVHFWTHAWIADDAAVRAHPKRSWSRRVIDTLSRMV